MLRRTRGSIEDVLHLKCTHPSWNKPSLSHRHGLCSYCMCGTQHALKPELWGTTLLARGILYLCITLFLCTSLSVLLLHSHTLFSNSDYTETLKELLVAQRSHKSNPSLPSFPLMPNEQKRWQTHAQKWSIFNFSPLFQVVSERERDVSKQEPLGR